MKFKKIINAVMLSAHTCGILTQTAVYAGPSYTLEMAPGMLRVADAATDREIPARITDDKTAVIGEGADTFTLTPVDDYTVRVSGGSPDAHIRITSVYRVILDGITAGRIEAVCPSPSLEGNIYVRDLVLDSMAGLGTVAAGATLTGLRELTLKGEWENAADVELRDCRAEFGRLVNRGTLTLSDSVEVTGERLDNFAALAGTAPRLAGLKLRNYGTADLHMLRGYGIRVSNEGTFKVANGSDGGAVTRFKNKAAGIAEWARLEGGCALPAAAVNYGTLRIGDNHGSLEGLDNRSSLFVERQHADLDRPWTNEGTAHFDTRVTVVKFPFGTGKFSDSDRIVLRQWEDDTFSVDHVLWRIRDMEAPWFDVYLRKLTSERDVHTHKRLNFITVEGFDNLFYLSVCGFGFHSPSYLRNGAPGRFTEMVTRGDFQADVCWFDTRHGNVHIEGDGYITAHESDITVGARESYTGQDKVCGRVEMHRGNGGSLTCGKALHLKAGKLIHNDFGTVFARDYLGLEAPAVSNFAGTLITLGSIGVRADLMANMRGEVRWRGMHQYCLTDAALMMAGGDADFQVGVFHNTASEMFIGGRMELNGSKFLEHNYDILVTRQHVHKSGRWIFQKRWVTWSDEIAYRIHPKLVTGDEARMRLTDQVTLMGMTHAPVIVITAGNRVDIGGAQRERDPQTLILDLREIARHAARGIAYKDDNGDIIARHGMQGSFRFADYFLGSVNTLADRCVSVSELPFEIALQYGLGSYAGVLCMEGLYGPALRDWLLRGGAAQGPFVYENVGEAARSCCDPRVFFILDRSRYNPYLMVPQGWVNPHGGGSVKADGRLEITAGDIVSKGVLDAGSGRIEATRGDVELATQVHRRHLKHGYKDFIEGFARLLGGDWEIEAAGNIVRRGVRDDLDNLTFETGKDVKTMAAYLERFEQRISESGGALSSKTTVDTLFERTAVVSEIKARGTVSVKKAQNTYDEGTQIQAGLGYVNNATGKKELTHAVSVRESSHSVSKSNVMGGGSENTLNRHDEHSTPCRIISPVIRFLNGMETVLQGVNLHGFFLEFGDNKTVLDIAKTLDTVYAYMETSHMCGGEWREIDAGRETAHPCVVDVKTLKLLEGCELVMDDRTQAGEDVLRQIKGRYTTMHTALREWYTPRSGGRGIPAQYMSAFIALAVTVATCGAAAPATVGAAMSAAGKTALLSQAACSLYLNQGNFLDTVKSMSSAQSIKRLAVTVAAAGICNAAGIGAGKNAAFTERLGHNLAKNLVRGTLDVVVCGDDPSEALVHAVKFAAVDTVAQELQSRIGADYKAENIGYLAHKIAHGIVGAGLGAAVGDDPVRGAVSGAVGAIAAEVVGEAVRDLKLENADLDGKSLKEIAVECDRITQESAVYGKLIGTALGFLGGDAQASVYSARSAVENNFIDPATALIFTAIYGCVIAPEIIHIWKTQGKEAAIERLIEHLTIDAFLCLLGGPAAGMLLRAGGKVAMAARTAAQAEMAANTGLTSSIRSAVTESCGAIREVSAESIQYVSEALYDGVAHLGGYVLPGMRTVSGVAPELISTTDAAMAQLHKNSLQYVGKTHVYRIVNVETGQIWKYGESANGVNKLGQSKRAQAQANKLHRETGIVYDTEIIAKFDAKKPAKQFEHKIITEAKAADPLALPGNKCNR